MDEKSKLEFNKLFDYLTEERQKIGELTALISDKIIQFRNISLTIPPDCSEKQPERNGILGELNKEVDSLKISRIKLEAVLMELNSLF